ncbi:MAG TPA: GDSL-type esterase/lipase family protein, partial [Candidatus Krumholzibacterium sp.]|nr:GDSL-type esterase/lipase family protein [Candidatus Krumholzibacterium sp.]
MSEMREEGNGAGSLRYLALGDSYTIGEGVPPGERWPVLLAEDLISKGYGMTGPEIVARTGWTTEELMAGVEEIRPEGPFDIVSLMIGVNDQYRGYEPGY